MSFTVILPQAVIPASAASERAIYLYYTHTKETARIVFKRNGQYVKSGLDELNYFLRDWRRNEPTQMDPRLFDLVWEVYQEVGASQPINVVSAYRSPKTNAMLRETSSGVAENSQHTKGHAMDFFIPGVSLSKLRAVAMRKQVGGVGFYPTSGSPFVHLDTGSVRAWPRMTRAQLKEIFPDGRTMHLPTDGKPLSQQGYQMAQAEWQRCHSVPCNTGSSGTQVASNGGGGGKTLLGMLFGGNDTPAAVAAVAPSRAAQAQQPQVQVASLAPQQATSDFAPTPMQRPASLQTAAASPAQIAPEPAQAVAIPFSTTGSAPLDDSELVTAIAPPLPMQKSRALMASTSSAIPSGDAITAIAALAAPIPQPRLIMTEAPQEDIIAAYLSSGDQGSLELIDNSITVASAPNPATRLPNLPGLTAATGLRTASLGGASEDALTGLFRGTFSATEQTNSALTSAALAEHLARRSVVGGMRNPELIAPDLEHIAEIFTMPEAMTSEHYAMIWDHDEADFDPTTEMGRYVAVMGVGDVPASLSSTSFSTATPVAIAN